MLTEPVFVQIKLCKYHHMKWATWYLHILFETWLKMKNYFIQKLSHAVSRSKDIVIVNVSVFKWHREGIGILQLISYIHMQQSIKKLHAHYD